MVKGEINRRKGWKKRGRETNGIEEEKREDCKEMEERKLARGGRRRIGER